MKVRIACAVLAALIVAVMVLFVSAAAGVKWGTDTAGFFAAIGCVFSIIAGIATFVLSGFRL